MKLEEANMYLKKIAKEYKTYGDLDNPEFEDTKKIAEAIETVLQELENSIPKMNIETLFNKAELRRLEKAARDKNKMKLAEWAGQFEMQMSNFYEKEYQKILAESIDNFLIAITYTLHFNEKCKFGNERIADFMDDLMEVVDGFKTGEFSSEEYKEELKKQKIYFE